MKKPTNKYWSCFNDYTTKPSNQKEMPSFFYLSIILHIQLIWEITPIRSLCNTFIFLNSNRNINTFVVYLRFSIFVKGYLVVILSEWDWRLNKPCRFPSCLLLISNCRKGEMKEELIDIHTTTTLCLMHMNLLAAIVLQLSVFNVRRLGLHLQSSKDTNYKCTLYIKNMINCTTYMSKLLNSFYFNLRLDMKAILIHSATQKQESTHTNTAHELLYERSHVLILYKDTVIMWITNLLWAS